MPLVTHPEAFFAVTKVEIAKEIRELTNVKNHKETMMKGLHEHADDLLYLGITKSFINLNLGSIY